MATGTQDRKIARVQRTLRLLEQDLPLLAMRVKDLSSERQTLARRFVASMIDQTRAELERLKQERVQQAQDAEFPCEPAD